MKYKVVPFGIQQNEKGESLLDAGARQLAVAINSEAQFGWEYVGAEVLPVVDRPGCLAVFLGKKGEQVPTIQLVFRKDES